MDLIGLLIGLAIAFGAALWVFNDAKERGLSKNSAFLWSFGTFVVLIIFLPIYLMVRPAKV